LACGQPPLGHYAEKTASGEAICRTENVSACHEGFRRLVQGDLMALSASVAGKEVADFKDKVNYKQPGGAGFSPHQDLPAYPGASEVVSILVAIDDCSVESGCLWVASGVDAILPTNERGAIRSDIVESLSWSPVELAAGDALCIGGVLPHFSEVNRSAGPRRVLIASYAPVSEGYTRQGYYAARRAGMEDATERDGRFRISTLADFEGIEVAPATAQGTALGDGTEGEAPATHAAGACTHA
jgi:2-aminoethylphosphonate dioxygenase